MAENREALFYDPTAFELFTYKHVAGVGFVAETKQALTENAATILAHYHGVTDGKIISHVKLMEDEKKKTVIAFETREISTDHWIIQKIDNATCSRSRWCCTEAELDSATMNFQVRDKEGIYRSYFCPPRSLYERIVVRPVPRCEKFETKNVMFVSPDQQMVFVAEDNSSFRRRDDHYDGPTAVCVYWCRKHIASVPQLHYNRVFDTSNVYVLVQFSSKDKDTTIIVHITTFSKKTGDQIQDMQAGYDAVDVRGWYSTPYSVMQHAPDLLVFTVFCRTLAPICMSNREIQDTAASYPHVNGAITINPDGSVTAHDPEKKFISVRQGRCVSVF